MATSGGRVKSARPTHRLKILHKASRRSTELAAGWQNEDGSISLVLNPGVELSWRDALDCVVTLFPANEPGSVSPPPPPPEWGGA